MIEITALCEKPVFAKFPITHFEDMKKLYYANVKKIIADEKTNVDSSVIEEGCNRFGKNLVISISDFSDKSLNLDVGKDVFADSEKYNDDFWFIDVGAEDIDVFALKNQLNEKNIETKCLKPAYEWSELKKNDDGLIPVIVTDYKNDKILMMAYMNEEAYYNTFKTGLMTYYSRSRKENI